VKFFTPKFFYAKIFLRQNFFTPKFFTPKFFYAKMFLRQKFFTPKVFYAKIFNANVFYVIFFKSVFQIKFSKLKNDLNKWRKIKMVV